MKRNLQWQKFAFHGNSFPQVREAVMYLLLVLYNIICATLMAYWLVIAVERELKKLLQYNSIFTSARQTIEFVFTLDRKEIKHKEIEKSSFSFTYNIIIQRGKSGKISRVFLSPQFIIRNQVESLFSCKSYFLSLKRVNFIN